MGVNLKILPCNLLPGLQRNVLLILLILFNLVIVLLSACHPGVQDAQAAQPKSLIWRAHFENSTDTRIFLDCEVASSENEKSRGLMFRESLAENSGMVFIYRNPGILRFWMKNTLIPLDIAFIDADLKIVSIKSMQAHDLSTTSSDLPALYAIEANKGWFKKNSVKPGMQVRFEVLNN